jgi:hypothetical protein
MAMNKKTNQCLIRVKPPRPKHVVVIDYNKKSKYFSIITIIAISLTLLLLCSFSVGSIFAQTYPFIASTRGSFDTTNGNMIQQTDLPSALSILNSNNCPGQLAIYVHGIWASERQAEEQTDRVSLSLQKSGNHIPVIGFTWDSNTPFSLDDINLSQKGWIIAKEIANENGPILAKFIVDFKNQCPNDKVRIIAHSLGSRVTMSAIQWLYDNNNATNNNNNASKIITSVHLLGAAINNNQISKNKNDCRLDQPPLPCSGVAIESKVGHFYNLYDPEDNMLADQSISSCIIDCIITFSSPYHISENKDALGASGKENAINAPFNYREHNVISKIINDDDADKDHQCDIVVTNNYCTIIREGDNHLGYMGYRSSANPQLVYNTGAIGSVVSDWRNESN